MEKEIYQQKINFFTYELEKIQGFLSDSTGRIGVLLTSAGLLSFLPQLGIDNDSYLNNFLVWTLPFFIGSLAAYFPASLRVQSIVKGHPFASSGSSMELEILKNRVGYFELVWRKTIERYDDTLAWNSRANSLVYAYMVSLITNFYVFAFYGEPSLCVSTLLLVASCIVAITLYVFPKIKSEKGRMIGSS